ncbi:hypothetical protein [Burkholderia pseudomallei]|uniref:hypothetical protein n=1 Tax=Burkholderia pseudomallei TaxID=28450 RepID=UPI0005378867|nr:hypothetical protein [Burkholderia pseudomallei]KGX47214.1 hypothetical protein Y043_5591 [Burkholderia pseudomallei MSHR2138]KGX47472.1 hypothetical protein Y600_5863 [Burkholderia pseudomallei MSHR3709]
MKWTAEQEALLRKYWFAEGSLKEHLHEFGDRSYEQVVSHAKKKLKFGPRPHLARGVPGYVLDRIAEELKNGPGTAPELIARTGLSRAGVCKYANKEVAGPSAPFHILKWIRRAAGGKPVPMFIAGPGRNAPEPSRLTGAEKSRRYRARRKVCSDPFATARGLVEVPDIGAGRVYCQPMNVTDDVEEAA